MSCITKTFNLLTCLFIVLIISANRVYALPPCSMKTEPSPLMSNTLSAKFIVNVEKNTNYSSYKMEFQCGASNNKDTASLEGSDSISRTLSNSGRCELGGGETGQSNAFHTIKVIAVTGTGDVDQCIASYQVINSDSKCTLTVKPSNGITSATKLTVSGENLTAGGRFSLFFDDDAVDIPNNPFSRYLVDLPTAANVATPAFGPKKIDDQALMTPGYHVVSLRQRVGGKNWLNPLYQERDFFGSPLCPTSFTVGTPDKPGAVSPAGTAPLTDICKKDLDKCSKAGGDPCGDTGNPGFKTAIGCIHTNPQALVKDFLTFAVAISGGLAFLMMLFGAFQMLTSAGNPDTLNAGRERLTSAIIGLLFVIFSILLMQLIGVDILGLPGFIK